MTLGVAIRAFFATLANAEKSAAVANVLDGSAEKPALPSKSTASDKPAAKATGGRSDALTLLSTLQREARFLDLVSEPLGQFEDAQIGAAAREVLKDCQQTLQRLFDLCPLSESEEGDLVDVDSSASPARQRIIGGSPKDQGTLVHRGWQARKVELPNWSGNSKESKILAPIEIDVEG